MTRVRYLIAIALFVVAADAAPAFAHEEISPSTLAVGKPTFLTLTAANEKTSNLTKVTLSAPDGLAFGEATRSPAGWTMAKTEAAITWTGGAVAPERFESWGFEIEGADQPGALSYKVNLGYADGSNEDATMMITATTDKSASASSDSGSGRANLALGLGLVALVVGGAALALASRGRADTPKGGAPAPGGAGQDW
jgi:hypothetical protein